MTDITVQTTAELQKTTELMKRKLSDFQSQMIERLGKVQGSRGAYLKLLQQREKALAFISKNPIIFFSILLSVLSIIFYFVFVYKRIERFLLRTDAYEMQPVSLSDNLEIITSNFKLCDFYIASSYKSFLPCNNYYDYASIRAVRKNLILGARLIDLDVFNDTFDEDTTPVICAGDEIGNWHYTNSISFDETCKMISQTAFNGSAVSNPSDPLFLSINFKTWYNKKTIDKCAEILKKYFTNKFLDQKYDYQGRETNADLSRVPITQLFNKVIIICTGNIKNTLMDELCNLHHKASVIFRRYNHLEIKDNYDGNELKEYNKQNLSIVVPKFDKRIKDNFNYLTAWYWGCQFICMNYTEPTDYMRSYAKRFKNCSFVLKKYQLRYNPRTIEIPQRQNSAVSMAPKKEILPSGVVVTV